MTPRRISPKLWNCLVGLGLGATGCTAVPLDSRDVIAKPVPRSSANATPGTSRIARAQPADADSRAAARASRSTAHADDLPLRQPIENHRRADMITQASESTADNHVDPTAAVASAVATITAAPSTSSATKAAAPHDAPNIVAKVSLEEPAGHAEPVAGLDSVYTLSLSNILFLTDAQNPNVAEARERINEAYARVERAETLWLPSLRAGLNYHHHEGAIQDVAGTVFNTNRSSFYGGMGANAVGAGSPAVPGIQAQFHLTDAVFQPRIAAHRASARQFGAAAVRNDLLRDAAVAYLELVRAEQALAISREAFANTELLTNLTRQYSETGQGLQSDYRRTEAELALRQEELIARLEAVQVASARLAQLLHADPSVVISSGEPAVVPLNLVTLEGGPAAYVATGLSRRPELAEQKHLVCEAVQRLRREQYAPLIPSVLLGMSYGALGGGLGSSIINTDGRWDADAVAYWEIRNLGFGERAARAEMSSLQRQTQMRELAIMDNVSREVVEAHTQVSRRHERIAVAQQGITAAQKSYTLNIQRIENAQGLPIETLQAIQALATAQHAYLNAVVDYNIAQFELSRAIGWFVES